MNNNLSREIYIPKRPKVVIEVSGGVAECTSGDDLVDVEIIDHDDLEEE